MNLVSKMEQEVLEQVMIKRERKKEKKVAPVPHQKMENHSKEEGIGDSEWSQAVHARGGDPETERSLRRRNQTSPPISRPLTGGK